MNALNVLCAQLTRDLFAIAKFLFRSTFRFVCVFGQLLIPVLEMSMYVVCTCELESLLEASRNVWLVRQWYKRVGLSKFPRFSLFRAGLLSQRSVSVLDTVAYRILYWV